MSDDADTTRRRNVLRGIAGGGAAASMGGVASGERAERDWDLTPRERSRLRAPYADPEAARTELLETAGPLAEELSARGLLDGELSTLLPDRVAEDELDAAPDEAIRLDTAWNEHRETAERLLQTTIETDEAGVSLSVNPDRGEAYAIVAQDGETRELLTASDGGVTTRDTSTLDLEVRCGDVCDDCCGVFDCTAERTVKLYDDSGTLYRTGCNCLKGGGFTSPYCCNSASCSGGFPCAC